MLLHERNIQEIVERVVERLRDELGAKQAPGPAEGGLGVYPDVESAAKAASRAASAIAAIGLEKRKSIVAAMRRAVLQGLGELSALAVAETGMGRAEHKVLKNRLVAEKTPGPEILQPSAVSGDDGLTLTELAPYGVIASIIPSTNPTETVVNNGIGMLSAGNAVIFNPHPQARRCSIAAISLLNRAVMEEGGPADCFVSVAEPTIETATALMRHPLVSLIVVTGGPAVVRAAMSSGKKVVAAGPGNPPAVVDETADLAKAARDIVAGASLDNNIVCTDEKVTVVVAKVADSLIREMAGAGCYVASAAQVGLLTDLLLEGETRPSSSCSIARRFVGKDARLLLAEIGVRDAGDPPLVICPVPPEHPLAWTEMLMPVMPVVRLPDVDAAIAYAVAVEGGRRHTASMHSLNIEKLSTMAREINCSIFVKNGPNYAGLGMGGEGYTSFTIASPTGDGLTTARTFSRERRCTLVGAFRIV
jgi:propionaldehyde dehydrogenase